MEMKIKKNNGSENTGKKSAWRTNKYREAFKDQNEAWMRRVQWTIYEELKERKKLQYIE